MNDWMRRLRGALKMGLTWAVGWGLVGGVMELLANLPGLGGLNAVDMWIQPLLLAGFLGGTIFSVALSIAARRRSFEQLSMPLFVVLGVVGGVVLGVGVLALFGGGVSALVVLPAVLLSTGSAAGTLALARRADGPTLPGPP